MRTKIIPAAFAVATALTLGMGIAHASNAVMTQQETAAQQAWADQERQDEPLYTYTWHGHAEVQQNPAVLEGGGS